MNPHPLASGKDSHSGPPQDRIRTKLRTQRRTYRFSDGVRVLVWGHDAVVWIYPDGRQVRSEGAEDDSA